MMLQVTCKLKYGTSVETYSDLAYLAFGSIGKFAVDFSLFTSQIGCCVAYLLFVGKQFDQVICFETSETFCGKKSDYIMIGALILIPVCCLKTFRFISYMSGFANVSIVFAGKLSISLIIFLQLLLLLSTVFRMLNLILTSCRI
jgi:proton-coupled amino acid transporter